MFEFGWSAEQYRKNRKRSKKYNALRHPSWHEIEAAKKECTPDGIECSEAEVKLSMQNALNHRLGKILKDKELVEKMQALKAKYPNVRFEMTLKYGADSSSAQAQNKNARIDDSSLFASNMVLLFIEAQDDSTGKTLNLWANRFANSALGVCPLRYAFEKESTGINHYDFAC